MPRIFAIFKKHKRLHNGHFSTPKHSLETLPLLAPLSTSSVQCRPAPFSHIFQRFPLEIVYRIFQIATEDSTATGVNLCLVSHEAFTWVLPVLYRSAVLRLSRFTSDQYDHGDSSEVVQRAKHAHRKFTRNAFLHYAGNYQTLTELSDVRQLAIHSLSDSLRVQIATPFNSVTHLYLVGGLDMRSECLLHFPSLTHLFAFYLHLDKLSWVLELDIGSFHHLPSSLTNIIISMPFYRDWMGLLHRLVGWILENPISFLGVMSYGTRHRCITVPILQRAFMDHAEVWDGRLHFLPFTPLMPKTWRHWCDSNETVWDKVISMPKTSYTEDDF
ncbi:hypothetical protein M422DRAFT_66335 [Sphaerobolus stellatus SS14]|nr:hypothetical protein M422DRAFT_66335 [Sphaerobolus stellatus SS14]